MGSTAAGSASRSPTTNWLRATALLIGCGLLAWLIAHFGVRDAWHAIRQVQPTYLAVYFVLAVATLSGCSARSFLVAHSTGATPPFRRFVAARLAGDAAGALLPGGRVTGDPLRAAMLYARGAGGVRASSWIVVDRIMELTGNTVAALGYVAVIALYQPGGAVIPVAAALLTGLLGLSAMVLLLWKGKRPLTQLLKLLTRGFPSLRRRLTGVSDVEDQLSQFFQGHTAAFVFGLFLSLAIEALIVFEYGCLFRAFGLMLDLPTLLVALIATGLSRGMPTPAGLGAMEAGQVAALTYGIGRPDLGFVAGVILRLHETFWLGLGALALIAEQTSRGYAAARPPNPSVSISRNPQ